MLNEITEIMKMVKDTIDELNQESMKELVGEIKEVMRLVVDKMSKENTGETLDGRKEGGIKVILSEIDREIAKDLTDVSDIIKEAVDVVKKHIESENIDCCYPYVICFVYKDARCVNIFNGACETWK